MPEPANSQAEPDQPRGMRTEWVTRKFDADGNLTSETTTTEVVLKPQDEQPVPGFFL